MTATLLQQITCVAGSGVFCPCHCWQPNSMQIPCAAASPVVAAAWFVDGKAACTLMVAVGVLLLLLLHCAQPAGLASSGIR
jgi:hypothetical protein